MGLFKTRRSDYRDEVIGGGTSVTLPRTVFDRFDHRILGLGDVAQPSKSTEAVCAIFDLAGFTDFCRQVDPHLAVPEFMTAFLEWIFTQIRAEAQLEEHQSENADRVALYIPLPFFSKFMGDGLMFLWDAAGLRERRIFGIASTASNIVDNYTATFLPQISRAVSEPPPRLRVGLARGRVFSVGNGSDFVGPCINIAARLQKLAGAVTFCFARRGFAIEKSVDQDQLDLLVLRRVAIRGIGANELVYIRKDEYDALTAEDKAVFREPPPAA